ncbi:MAG: DUF4956 domain-containing protein [Methanobrevibacter sp.]|nr:DUF4956 domain-containing protein [Methanobrevibacter sp.]
MSKEDIFTYFYTNSVNLGIKTILLIMLGAVLISAIIYLTYYLSYRGTAYNSRFNGSLVLMLLISVVIMLMISSNIVISLGMVGALSIVRFRTAVKDSRDTVFIFWAIAEGLSVGSQNFKLALVTTLIIAIVLLAMTYIPKTRNKYMLVVTGGKKEIERAKIMKILDKYAVSTKIRTVSRDGATQEMVIELSVKKELKSGLVDEILKVKGVEAANLVMQSNETVG